MLLFILGTIWPTQAIQAQALNNAEYFNWHPHEWGLGILLISLLLASFVQLHSVHSKLTITHEQLNDCKEQLADLKHEKNTILHIVANELQSPIGGIHILNQLLSKYGPLNEKQLEYQQMIQEELNKGDQLIRNIMLLYLFENNKQFINVRQIDLYEELMPLLNQHRHMAMAKDITIKIDWERTTPFWVYTDLGYIATILDNLLSNAIQHSPKGKNVYVQLAKTEEQFVLMIKDEGPGFTSIDKRKVFKKFQHLSNEPIDNKPSYGIGLAITKAMIDQLNGELYLDSFPGKGALFKATFPHQVDSLVCAEKLYNYSL